MKNLILYFDLNVYYILIHESIFHPVLFMIVPTLNYLEASKLKLHKCNVIDGSYTTLPCKPTFIYISSILIDIVLCWVNMRLGLVFLKLLNDIKL